jgi:hypothetical protein
MYFPTMSVEVSNALGQLHSAMNWGLTLLSASLVAVLSRQRFPDEVSLYVLLVTVVVGFHFATRTMKGYINVVRYGLLQRSISDRMLGSSNGLSDDAFGELRSLVVNYHIEWRLPLKKRDVYRKGVFELGYGYLLATVIGLAVYVLFHIQPGWRDWAAVGASVLLLLLEVYIFVRSPYMRKPFPNIAARSQR